MPRHILVDKQTTYDKWFEAGKIDEKAVYFIRDTKKLYTHGYDFLGNSGEGGPSKSPYKLIFRGLIEDEYDGGREVIIELPTSLPASDVPEWAKAAVKPSYTPDEIGAAAEVHSHSEYITGFILNPEDTGNAITGVSIDPDTRELVFTRATTFLVQDDLTPYAKLESPEFTGTPTSITYDIDDTNKIATNRAVKEFVEGKNYVTAEATVDAAKKWAQSVTVKLQNQIKGQFKLDGSEDVDVQIQWNTIPLNYVPAMNRFVDPGDYTGSGLISNGPLELTENTWQIRVYQLKSLDSITNVIRQEIFQDLKEYYRQGTRNESGEYDWTDWRKRIDSTDSISGSADNVTGIVNVAHGGTGLDSIPSSYMIMGGESGEPMIPIQATSVNVPSTVVLRDDSGKIYATEFIGNWSGIAREATKATQDSEGNVIIDTYIKKSDSIFLGNTPVNLSRNEGDLLLSGVSIDGNASKDSEGRIIKDTYLEKDGCIYLGTTRVNYGNESGSITSLDIDVTGKSSESNVSIKLKTPIDIIFKGNITGVIKNFDGSQNAEVELSYDPLKTCDLKYLKLIGGNLSGNVTFTNPDTGIYVTNARIIGPSIEAANSQPISFIQYSDDYKTEIKRVVLLDESGNSNFPGEITATKFKGQAESAIKDDKGRTISDTYYLANSSFYIGTTEISANRKSGRQTLSGVDIDGSSASCTGNAATVTNGAYVNAENKFTEINSFDKGLVSPNYYIKLSNNSKGGFTYYDGEYTNVKYGIGVKRTSNESYVGYIGWGSNPSDPTTSLRVSSTELTYKGYPLYHSGNCNNTNVNWETKDLHVAGDATFDGQFAVSDLVVDGTEKDLLSLIQADGTRTAVILFQSSDADKILTTTASFGVNNNGEFVFSSDETQINVFARITQDGVIIANSFKGDVEGNASSATEATRLTKKIKLKLTGDVVGESDETDFSNEDGVISINTTTTSGGENPDEGVKASLTVDDDKKVADLVVGQVMAKLSMQGHNHDERYYTEREIDDQDSWLCFGFDESNW